MFMKGYMHSRIENIPAIMALLQLIRSGLVSSAERRLTPFPSSVDWDEVGAIARTQGIIPLVYKALRDGAEADVPAAFIESVRKDFHRNGLLVEMQKGALFHVQQTFGDAGVPVLFLKGPVLGAMAYGSPIWRKAGDVDVLIHRSHYEPARQALMQAGYKPDVSPEAERRMLEQGAEMVFNRNGFEVDLHWSLEQSAFNRFPFSPGLDEEGVWERSISLHIDNKEVPCLSCEDTLYFLCAHGGKHAWTYLYMIGDIAKLIHEQNTLQWNHVIGLAEKLNSQRITYMGLYLAQSVFDLALPDWVHHTIKRHVIIPSLAQKAYNQLFRSVPSFSSFQYHRIRAGLLRKKSERALYGMCLINRQAKKLSNSLIGV